MTGDGPARRIGLDSYSLDPLDLPPVATVEWAAAHGANGVSFSGLPAAHRDRLDEAALADLGACARSLGLTLEWGGAQHIPRDLTTWAPSDLRPINQRAAKEAVAVGATIVRSCSGGLMRWDPEAPPTETLLRETAAALVAQRGMLEDHGVTLAIETHFEFTSHELVRLFERAEAPPGGWLGNCLDTMNLLTLLEEPIAATRRLLPWVVSTHIKDGALLLTPGGLTTFPTAIGDGVIDLAAIVRLLPPEVCLAIEDHGGSFDVPIFDPLFLSAFPDLTAAELARLVGAAERSARLGRRPLARADWPAICEARVGRDLAALRSLAGRVSTDGRA